MFLWKHHHVHESKDDIDTDARAEAKINQLRAALEPLSEHDSHFCDDPCLRRYLVARNWNLDKSKKMLQGTLNWRSVYKPQEIRWHEIASEGETGKIYRASFYDREGRSVLVLRPARQNTTSQDNQIRHLVYLLENAILNLAEGQEQMVWLIDFTGWSLTKAVPVKTARETAEILQSHYPERLSSAFLYNPPRIFETFWKVVKYFLDPKTVQKVKFIYPKNEQSVELMQKNFDLSLLPTEFGGSMDYHYDHEENSRLMAKDDIKMESLWGISGKQNQSTNGYSPLVAPESLPSSLPN